VAIIALFLPLAYCPALPDTTKIEDLMHAYTMCYDFVKSSARMEICAFRDKYRGYGLAGLLNL